MFRTGFVRPAAHLSQLVILSAVLLVLFLGRAEAESPTEAPRKGSVVLAGGATLPERVYEEFVIRAGGKEAQIVVVPTAFKRWDESMKPEIHARWKHCNLKQLEILHAKSREEADSIEFSQTIRNANGVWFGGGEQDHLASRFIGTKSERALLELLDRGGIIGGTSAGAAIMSQTMIAGGKLSPKVEVGFPALSDWIVDQHFSQKNREPRLLEALSRHGKLYGIGVDENTAVFIDRGTNSFKVFGKGKVFVYRPAPKASHLKAVFTESDSTHSAPLATIVGGM